MKYKIVVLLIAVTPVFIFNACQKDSCSDIQSKTNILIDTDANVDDAMAIAYLLQCPDISIDGITIAGTGMSYPNPAKKHILGLIELANKPDIPVAVGDTIAINSNNTLLRPVKWLTMTSNFMGINLPLNPNSVVEKSAVEFLIDFLDSTDKPIRLITLGPLTNIGQVLLQDPNLSSKIETIYIMGGAVNISGNLNEGGIENNHYAEWNIFLDPHAADIVFRSGINITLVPLDVTVKAPITTEFLNRISNNHNTPEANFVYEMISKLLNSSDNVCFWDPLAAAISTDRNITNTITYPISIVTQEGDENGRTKIDSVSGNMISVCNEIDLEGFETLFLDILNGK